MSQSTAIFGTDSLFQAMPYPDSLFKTSHTLKFGYKEPKMDLYEDPVTNTVTAIIELPGLSKEDVRIYWIGDQISIGAEIPERDTSGHKICERIVGKFRRTLMAPRGIQEEDIKASLKDGLLTLSFPLEPKPLFKKIMIS